MSTTLYVRGQSWQECCNSSAGSVFCLIGVAGWVWLVEPSRAGEKLDTMIMRWQTV